MSSPFNQLGLIRDRFSGTHPRKEEYSNKVDMRVILNTQFPVPSSQFPVMRVPSSQFPVPSNKFQSTSHKSPIPSSTPLYYLDIRERSLSPCSKSHVPNSRNERAMGNLENHRRLSASVYGSLPHSGANESVFLITPK